MWISKMDKKTQNFVGATPCGRPQYPGRFQESPKIDPPSPPTPLPLGEGRNSKNN